MTDRVAAALLAIAGSDPDAARHLLAAEPAGSTVELEHGSLVARALAQFLERAGAPGTATVYTEPSGFETFIDEGGNRALYRATIAAVAAVHRALAPETVLDVGCGDGRVTAAVVQGGASVDLVEPSAPLLQSAIRRLDRESVTVTAHHSPIDTVLDVLDERDGVGGTSGWDLVQATFALHAIAPARRPDVLARLARRAASLVVVEFDVPDFEDRSAAHAAYAAARYEHGLAEYGDHPEVISDFLLPVLVSQFDPDRPRHTFEQPIEAWHGDLRATGWRSVRSELVADYWWAPAHLIRARGRLRSRP